MLAAFFHRFQQVERQLAIERRIMASRSGSGKRVARHCVAAATQQELGRCTDERVGRPRKADRIDVAVGVCRAESLGEHARLEQRDRLHHKRACQHHLVDAPGIDGANRLGHRVHVGILIGLGRAALEPVPGRHRRALRLVRVRPHDMRRHLQERERRAVEGKRAERHRRPAGRGQGLLDERRSAPHLFRPGTDRDDSMRGRCDGDPAAAALQHEPGPR